MSDESVGHRQALTKETGPVPASWEEPEIMTAAQIAVSFVLMARSS
jgi:hypothetical protein